MIYNEYTNERMVKRVNNYFGERMRHFRKERGWTLDDLAARIGSSKQVLSRYESGKRNPKISAAKKISDALGVELDDMVDWSFLYEEPEEIKTPVIEAAVPPETQALIDFVKTIPPEKADHMLKVMKAILDGNL